MGPSPGSVILQGKLGASSAEPWDRYRGTAVWPNKERKSCVGTIIAGKPSHPLLISCAVSAPANPTWAAEASLLLCVAE